MNNRLVAPPARVLPPPGTIVSVPFVGGVHLGLLSDKTSSNGEPFVLNNSKRHHLVVEESLGSFAEGRRVRIEGYPSQLPPDEVLRRARSRLGWRWQLGKFNCEHYVRFAHGLPVESQQVEQAVAAGTVLSALMRLIR